MEDGGDSAKPLCLSIGSFQDFSRGGNSVVQLPCILRPSGNALPPEAMVDDVIAAVSLGSRGDCCGFLAVAKQESDDDYYGYDDDSEEEQPESTGLATKLLADGGVLIARGQTLASYGIDAKSCSEVTFYPVFNKESEQPIVFNKDLQDAGFGETVYKYVKLHTEDREIVAARQHFSLPLFPWLQNGGDLAQSIEFSMEDSFITDKPRMVLTVNISQDGEVLNVSCSNLGGTTVCSFQLVADDMVAKLQSSLCHELKMASIACWDGAERVPDSDQVSKYSLLTAEQASAVGPVLGCYQQHRSGCHPAGYSASGSSSSDYIVLEPGRACLKSHFKGDYKRAEELRKLVIVEAQWSIEDIGDGKEVVRIHGEAVIDRYFVHERSGHDEAPLRQYACHCLVKIPVEQLLAAQREEYHHKSTPGSGWTCGSEDYRCSFFLPLPLLSALRMPDVDDGFTLRKVLNKDASPDYPNELASARYRYGRQMVCKVQEQVVDLLRHFRENLTNRADVSLDDIRQLQASAPKVMES